MKRTKRELEKRIRKAKTAVLIVNTYSRRGEKLFFRVLDLLQKRGIRVTASYPVRHPDRLPEVVTEAIRRKGDLVIVGGGDGTISSIVDYFAYKDIVFGLLPLGTGNSFARSLGIPLDLEGAIDVMVNGKVSDVDLGKVNDDYFANVISIGFPAEVARATPRWLKRITGPLAYGIIGIRYLFTTQKFRCDLTVNGKKQTAYTHQIIVANGSFYGIMPLGKEAHVDNRLLFVLTMNMMSRWKLLYFWLMFFLNKHKTLSEVIYFTTEKVSIVTDPVRYIDIDGESVAQTPAVLSVAPEALKIMTPKEFEELYP